MAKAKNTTNANRDTISGGAASAAGALAGGALMGGIHDEGDEDIVPNSQGTHQGLHDGVEADLHFGDDVHGPEQEEENWKEPNALDAPPPRPGFKQRWIRLSLVGKVDAKNQSAQGQAGWRPRALSSVSAGERGRYPTIKDRRTSGEFMVSGDLILCEMPEWRFNKMRDHYRGKAAKQMNALRDDIGRARIPGSEAKGLHAPEIVENTRSGGARRPVAQPD